MYFTNDELIFIECAVAMITAVWLSVSSSAVLKLLNAIFVPNEIASEGEGFGEGFAEGFGEGFGEGFAEGFGEGFGEGFAEGFGEGFAVGRSEDIR